MPGKSRHGRRKLPRSKRRRERQNISAISPPQEVATETHKPTSHPEVLTPSVSVPTKMATVATTQYSYVAAELQRIGILTGVILVILVLLALVLS